MGPRRGIKWSATNRDKAISCCICLRKCGLPITEIAGKTGKNKGNIHRWLREYLPANPLLTSHLRSKATTQAWMHGKLKSFGRSPGMSIQRANKIILADYKSELWNCSKPERLWAKIGKTAASVGLQRKLRHTSPKHKAMFYARKRIRRFIKQRGYKPESSITKAIGCSPDSLRLHIERQFRDGMSWDNHGTLWHIDHIIPVSSADKVSQVYKLAHYSNLQPLLVHENMAKTDKIMRQSTLCIW